MENWAEKLLVWYDQEKRDLPWRRSSDPYAIWVSEIMLQQTRVETVKDYYQRWMKRFPDIKSLAEADPQSVLKQWEGLGYYSRVRNMQKAAQQIMADQEGHFPSSYQQILDLPGIGPYTAGAIASIAFGQSVPAVDGNVLRVMSRFFQLVGIDEQLTKQAIRARVEQSIPPARSGDYTQALMELGALVCLPRKPACASCPLRSECQAYLQNMQDVWPTRQEKNQVRKVDRLLAVIQKQDQILMHQRPAKGLLADLWEFPGVDGEYKKDLAARFQEEFGLSLKVGKLLLTAGHVFTHLEWDMKVYQAALLNPDDLTKQPEFLWVDKHQLDQLAIPAAFQKIKQAVAAR